MGLTLLCGDVVPGCSAEFQGDDMDELMGQVGEHASQAHPEIALTPEVQTAVQAAVRSD